MVRNQSKKAKEQEKMKKQIESGEIYKAYQELRAPQEFQPSFSGIKNQGKYTNRASEEATRLDVYIPNDGDM